MEHDLLLHVREFIHLFPFRLSKKSKTYLRMLCKQIHRSTNHLPILERVPIDDMNVFMSDARNIPLYNAIPEIIQKNIDKTDKKGRSYTFTIDARTITIHLVLPIPTNINNDAEFSTYSRIYNSDDLLNEFFERCIFKIAVWLRVAFQFASKSCANELRCYIFFTHHSKSLPEKNGEQLSFITSEHANTGFTTSCAPHSTIMLYRREEWYKVFIHETFHSLGLDFSEFDADESNKQIIHLFPGCSNTLDVRVYETYCEMWAETINVMLVAYFSERHAKVDVFSKHSRVISKPKKNSSHTRKYVNNSRIIDRTISKTERFLKYERAYTMYQAAKVLNHYNLEYTDLCQENVEGSTVQKYTEHTAVFSYYIVKSVLFYHVNEFFEWCYTHNGGHSTILHFLKNRKNIREYSVLIGRLYKMPDFIKKLEVMKTYVKKHSLENRGKITETLRMTLYETY